MIFTVFSWYGSIHLQGKKITQRHHQTRVVLLGFGMMLHGLSFYGFLTLPTFCLWALVRPWSFRVCWYERARTQHQGRDSSWIQHLDFCNYLTQSKQLWAKKCHQELMLNMFGLQHLWSPVLALNAMNSWGEKKVVRNVKSSSHAFPSTFFPFHPFTLFYCWLILIAFLRRRDVGECAAQRMGWSCSGCDGGTWKSARSCGCRSSEARCRWRCRRTEWRMWRMEWNDKCEEGMNLKIWMKWCEASRD